MDMDSSETQFVCPPHVYRLSHDDDQRQRILKEVLRSTIALQEQENKNKSRRNGQVSWEGLPALPRKMSRAKCKARSFASVQDLQQIPQRDEECLAIAGSVVDDAASPASPLLRDCGRRITTLCERLKEAEETLERVQAETQAASSSNWSPSTEIRIIDRPEESPAVVRARNERVVYDFVSRHATFDRLESFKETFEQAEGFEGMREIFPRRFQYHPGMLHLNDDVLKDPAKLKAAIWKRHEDDIATPQSLHSRKSRSRTTATNFKMDMSTRSSTLAQRRSIHSRSMRKDHSAPVLPL